MKKSILFIGLVMAASATFAQKKVTTSATLAFDATTPSDAFPKAENKTAIASIDTKTGAVAFESIMKNFAFGNPMMQDHFNSPKWLDSEKFPTATFKGIITNFSDVDFKKDGIYNAEVQGDLTIRGETAKVKTTATIVVNGKTFTTNSAFTINLDNYKISSPSIGTKILKEPKITVFAEFK